MVIKSDILYGHHGLKNSLAKGFQWEFLTRPSSEEPRSSTKFWEEAEEEEDSFEKVAIPKAISLWIIHNLILRADKCWPG